MLLKKKLKKKVFQNNTDYFKFINKNKDKIKIKSVSFNYKNNKRNITTIILLYDII